MNAVRPTSGPRLPLLPVIILIALWGTTGVAGLVWVSGRLASLLTGHGWSHGLGFGFSFISALLTGRWARLWPEVSPPLVAVISAVLLAAAIALILGMWRRVVGKRPSAHDPTAALATTGDLAALGPGEAAKKARQLRASLATTPVHKIAATDTGLALGVLKGTRTLLRASWEDVLVAIMAPRSGKTTALAIPTILQAPGPVIATSNKADLWAATAQLRAATGRVWVFDPQAIAHHPQTWWFNPLASVTTVEAAHRLAGHFMQHISGRDKRDFWIMAAHDLLAGLLLAAALQRSTLQEVYGWLNDPSSPAPEEILRNHGFEASAQAFNGRQQGAPQTRDGIYETARTAAACLRDPAIMAWVSPQPLPAFDPHTFASSREAVYLMSKDGAQAAAPLVAALTDAIFNAATHIAEARGGRIDPPVLAVLDEAANVCRISDLPDLYSHLGSRGVIALTILQSYKQGVRVWAEDGMAALWSAATIKLIGPGMDDARFTEQISTLVGDRDVAVSSYSHTYSGGGGSESVSLRRQRILSAADIRALPKGSALLLATGTKPALIDMQPWYDSPYAPTVQAAIATATHEVTQRASQTNAFSAVRSESNLP